MSMNSRLLPQNKISFGYDQLAKFANFAQKNVPMIQTFSLRMEDTLVMRRSRGTCWD